MAESRIDELQVGLRVRSERRSCVSKTFSGAPTGNPRFEAKRVVGGKGEGMRGREGIDWRVG